ncbi:MAG: toxin-antitoxin system YwqK family antitoxin [SAR324 cluster bacterium]|nr:toxin-antitoxin system YwqK family antitoxin [SAR324 cluster bacterium]
MRILTLLTLVLLAPAGTGFGGEYVTTPGGIEVKLETWAQPAYGPRWLFIRYQYYVAPDGQLTLHGDYARLMKGKRREFTRFNHGVKHGPFAKWYDEGQLEMEGRYVEGKLEGPVTRYYESGKLKEVVNFTAGELEGTYTFYYRSGRKREEGSFLRGRKEGRFMEYHPNGAVAIAGTFHQGYLTGRLTYTDSQGRMVAEGKLASDLVTGAWICYGTDGRVQRVREDCRERVYVECACE